MRLLFHEEICSVDSGFCGCLVGALAGSAGGIAGNTNAIRIVVDVDDAILLHSSIIIA